MKKEQKEQETRAKCAYVPPRVEVCVAEPGRLMGTSFYTFEHNPGTDNDGDSDHHGGSDGGVEYGAKTVILGQEFGFSDVWEE